MNKILPVILIFFISCNVSETKKDDIKHEAHSAKMDTFAIEAKKPLLNAAMLDDPKDPVCRMPMKSDIADTTLYKQKVYGFCAKECKEEFIKNPESFLTSK